MANDSIALFDFYLRYPWGPSEFDDMQQGLVDTTRESFAAFHSAGLLTGGVVAPSGSTMAVTVTAFTALNDDGYLNVKNTTSLVPMDVGDGSHPRYDIIVARPSLVNGTMITRPTSPFDSVPLTTLQKTALAVIKGTPGVSPTIPAKVSGDVILAVILVPQSATSISSPNIDQIYTNEIGRSPRFASAAKDLRIVARSLNASAVYGEGNGTGMGGYFVGGLNGGNGVNAYGKTTGYGLYALSGTTDGTSAVYGISGATNGFGVTGIGTGTGAGGVFAGQGSGTAATDDAVIASQNIKLAGSNPAAGTGFLNRVTPMNTVKAWALVRFDGTTPTIQAGFNVTNPRYANTTNGTNYGLLVDIVTDMASTAGAVMANSSRDSGTASSLCSFQAHLSAAGTIAVEGAVGGTPVDLSGIGTNNFVSIMVLGAQ